ncbi:ABC transporter permease [Streptomyces scopuliridis]|uniref:ABC transporter permease n=1 Tax=Streptomyces scopuliridis TaxID=452529 RepID=UPI002DDB5F63|nr:ABC transporter permease [Streptomyces scopuliridis]WSB34526.1 ABC transporter permease [Streptomyces scopuliridis]
MWWIYRTEVRRSALRWALPAFVAVDLLVLFGRSRHWIGVWPEASAAAQIPAFYLGPALAGAAAWSAASRRRSGVVEQLAAAAKSSWRVELAQLSATLTYGVLAYTLGALTAAGVTVPEAGPEFWWPGYILLGLALITICTGVGHLLGRTTKSLFAVPVICALGCLVFLGVFGFAPGTGSSGIGLAVLSGYPYTTVSALPLTARLLLGIGLIALAAGVGSHLRSASGRPGWPGLPLAGLSGVGLVAIAVVLFVTAGPLLAQREVPADPLCTHSKPQICVWPESQKFAPEFEAMSARIAALPPGLIKSPDVFYEDGVRGGPLDMGRGFYIFEGQTWDAATSMAIRLNEASSPPYCDPVDEAANDRRLKAQLELISWLTVRIAGNGQPAAIHGGPPGVDQKAIRVLVTRPEAEQVAWATARYKVVRETPCASE